MAIDILCVGHASFDLSVFVDSFPLEDSKCETQDLRESGGGPAAEDAGLRRADVAGGWNLPEQWVALSRVGAAGWRRYVDVDAADSVVLLGRGADPRDVRGVVVSGDLRHLLSRCAALLRLE